jgi:hypothetical protein
MSFTRKVPSCVPSLRQSSQPYVGSKAAKKSARVHVHEPIGERAVGAGIDVLHEEGAVGCAVTSPELRAVGRVPRPEKKRPVHVRQLAGEGEELLNVRKRLDEDGARSGAVALPEPGATARRVVIDEEENAVHIRELGRVVPLLDEGRTGSRAVASPEVAVTRRGGGDAEEERAVHAGQLVGRGACAAR